ncbi:MAG: hypothetical protein IH627_00125 [Rubrivivax sp.]|nr:hypothetical protein [Rubrivivax sp.]
MPNLNWDQVRQRYPDGTMVPHITGSRKFEVLRVADDAVYFKWAVINEGTVSRCNLERAVELLNEGVLLPDPSSLTSDYRTLVSDERPTIAIALLKDLGFW